MYRNSLTIRQKEINTNRAIITIAVSLLFATTYAFIMSSNTFTISGGAMVSKVQAVKQATPQSVEKLDSPVVSTVKVLYREFTAYNAGDPYQCDNTPCISASGDNICTLLAQGQIIFASNEFPLGTKLYVEGIGEGIVLDRMNSRFKTRIDLAMQAHEKPRAVSFGLQTLAIRILK